MYRMVRLGPDDYRDFRSAYSRIEYSYSKTGEEETLIEKLAMEMAKEKIRTKPEFLKDLNEAGREMYFLRNEENAIIGYAELIFGDMKCEIFQFSVFEKGVHYGTILLDEVMKIMKEHGTRSITLWCPFEGAQIFWEKKGFKPYFSKGKKYHRMKVR